MPTSILNFARHSTENNSKYFFSSTPKKGYFELWVGCFPSAFFPLFQVKSCSQIAILQGALLFLEPEVFYWHEAGLLLPVRLSCPHTGFVADPPGTCWALDSASPEALRQSCLNSAHAMGAWPHFLGRTNAGV